MPSDREIASAHERIYHFHVRKTAGSSLDAAFLSLGGIDGLDKLERATRHGLVGNGKRFVAHNPSLIESGDYFFGTSHLPAWWIKVPRNTFTVTILRDPCARIISYYRYLLWARGSSGSANADPFIDRVREESSFLDGGLDYTLRQLYLHNLRFERSAIWSFGLGHFLARLTPGRREGSFTEFLSRIPPRHLFAQLHMFSERFDPGEASEKALSCSAVCFTETFSDDLKNLGARLNLRLPEKRERSFGDPILLTNRERELLQDRMAPEYKMIERVKAELQREVV